MSVYGCEARRRENCGSKARVVLYVFVCGLYDFMCVQYLTPMQCPCVLYALIFSFLRCFHLVLANSPRIRNKFILLHRLGAGEAGEC
jgi:hypothetical protein